LIQDIAPHRLNNQYDVKIQAKPEDPVYCFRKDELLVKEADGGNISLPKVNDFPPGSSFRYVFAVDGRPYFLYKKPAESLGSLIDKALSEEDIYYETGSDSKEEVAGREDLSYVRLQTLRENLPVRVEKWQYFAAITAFHLFEWYEGSRFCGRCGHKTIHSETERCMICPQCGNHIYPKIVPAVIVGVTNNDKLLVTRYARRPIGYDALVAGFTEIGETVEETVAREVKEETGLNVKNIRYYKSQPWGMVSDVLMGFYCDVDGDDTVHLDGELGQALWLTADRIKGQPDDMSLTNEMMMYFKKQHLKGATV